MPTNEHDNKNDSKVTVDPYNRNAPAPPHPKWEVMAEAHAAAANAPSPPAAKIDISMADIKDFMKKPAASAEEKLQGLINDSKIHLKKLKEYEKEQSLIRGAEPEYKDLRKIRVTIEHLVANLKVKSEFSPHELLQEFNKEYDGKGIAQAFRSQPLQQQDRDYPNHLHQGIFSQAQTLLNRLAEEHGAPPPLAKAISYAPDAKASAVAGNTTAADDSPLPSAPGGPSI